MDIYTHTALVLLVILLTYLITYFLSMKKYIEYGVEYILAKLERENFIRVEYSGPIKKLITVSETHSELYMENEILKNNVHELEKQLNEARKKVVDKVV